MAPDEARHQELGAIAGVLQGLRDDELLEVLRLVFEARTPFPEEAAFHRSRYFLGLASSVLEDESDPDAGKYVWGEWNIAAAAYPDVEHYGTRLGPECGFAEEGDCQNCHVNVRGLLKQGTCPVCGERVYMT